MGQRKKGFRSGRSWGRENHSQNKLYEETSIFNKKAKDSGIYGIPAVLSTVERRGEEREPNQVTFAVDFLGGSHCILANSCTR